MDSEVLRVAVDDRGTGRRLFLRGELDSYTSEGLAGQVDAWTWGVSSLLVNLDGLEYIDSAGLSLLVALWVRAMEKGVKLDIACKSPRIQRVLEITGLLNLFQLDSTAPEAQVLIAERMRRAPSAPQVAVLGVGNVSRHG